MSKLTGWLNSRGRGRILQDMERNSCIHSSFNSINLFKEKTSGNVSNLIIFMKICTNSEK